jgi:acetylornithine deacetylase
LLESSIFQQFHGQVLVFSFAIRNSEFIFLLMNVTDLTKELIALPSVNPNSLTDGRTSDGEKVMADRVEVILRALGAKQFEQWEPYEGRPSVMGYMDFGAPETLIFDAHLDTVPVEGMTVDPFGGTERDGKIYGRGACDVKGPMAAMLMALHNVKRSEKARFNVLFAGVCDEESGFGGVESFVKRLDKSAYAPIVGGIIAEPTLLNPVAAHKGTARWIVAVGGVAAHSSTPHLGQNAIYKASHVIQRLEKYAAELQARTPHAKLGTPTLSIGIIHGGSAVNIVPDHCELHVDRRLIPGETLGTAWEDLEQTLAGLDVDISTPLVAAPPMDTDPDSTIVQLALAAGRAAGASSEVESANYCTDASFYPQIEVPTVVFGPGSIAQAHTKDEWISIDQLEMGVRAYEALIGGAGLQD